MAAEVPVPEKPKGRRKLLIIIVASAALILTSAAVGAAWWLSTGSHRTATPASAPKTAVPAGPPLFVALDPPFVVNFDSEQAVRFLQISVQLETHDPATIEMLKTNDPIVRNDLLLLFGNQKYAELATREGKEALRNQALADVRKVLEAAGGHPERLDAVYFTSFVMQ
jgi:flagellar protein FliL